MDKELLEALNACDVVLKDIDKILDQLNSARNWGIWDIIGGGFFTSSFKYSKIEKAEELTNTLKDDLEKLKKELLDINLDFKYELLNERHRFFDIFFDNIFSDLNTQDEIKRNIESMEDLKNKVLYIREKIKD